MVLGLLKGSIVEILCPESSGKITLALHVIAGFKKKGGLCKFIDAEHDALNVIYACKLEVNTDSSVILQPKTGGQALHIVECLVCSVTAFTPKGEIERDIGD